jgi:hypothetical protein
VYLFLASEFSQMSIFSNCISSNGKNTITSELLSDLNTKLIFPLTNDNFP